MGEAGCLEGWAGCREEGEGEGCRGEWGGLGGLRGEETCSSCQRQCATQLTIISRAQCTAVPQLCWRPGLTSAGDAASARGGSTVFERSKGGGISAGGGLSLQGNKQQGSRHV